MSVAVLITVQKEPALMPVEGAQVVPLGGNLPMWNIVVRQKDGTQETFKAQHPPGFYPEGVMTFVTVENRWITYTIGVLARVDYWQSG